MEGGELAMSFAIFSGRIAALLYVEKARGNALPGMTCETAPCVRGGFMKIDKGVGRSYSNK